MARGRTWTEALEERVDEASAGGAAQAAVQVVLRAAEAVS